MSDLNKIVSIVDSDEVQEGLLLPKIHLHKWLVLGQTEYVCEYGTLSDGHEHITPAQRYAQAIKEQYALSQNVAMQKSIALEAQADLLDALDAAKEAKTESAALRAEAKRIVAQAKLTSALVTVEDQMRMIKVYARVRSELGPEVERQYPAGIEQAEPANWVAVAEYRHSKGGRENMTNLPLEPRLKAALGVAMGRPDMAAWLMVSDKKEIGKLPSQTINEYLGLPFESSEKMAENN